ncbi:MAG: signal peptidase II [Phormidesmis sp.]
MKPKNALFWLAAIVGIILDYLTKAWVVENFDLQESVTIISGVLNFTYVINEGAAFSLFSENGDWLKWLSLLVSAGLALYGWFARIPNRWEAAGYGFILGGAFGNGIERFAQGYVVDFLAIFPSVDLPILNHPFPIFNVADIWINLGILCLLAVAFQEPDEGSQPPSLRTASRSTDRPASRRTKRAKPRRTE